MKRGFDIEAIRIIHRLYKYFKINRFEIVQYSTPNASLYSAVAAYAAGIPIRLYSQWGIYYTGSTGINRKILRLIEKSTSNLSTHIRPVSKMNLDFAVSEGLYTYNKAKLLGNGGTIGVDLSEYDLNRKNKDNVKIREKYVLGDKFVFGFIGRISIDKGCIELLRSFRRIADKLNSSSIRKAHLLMIGEIEDNIKEYSEYSQAIVSEDITFVGSVPKDAVKMYYSTFDAYVHPTYREGFGMVLQEAAAMELPIITTKIPGASEVLVENESCILVNKKNEDELFDSMLKLFESPELCRKLGTAARRHVEQNYERSYMLNNQLADYQQILSKLT
jgi:glycosyltransferase involved in cell wall biosynthesis